MRSKTRSWPLLIACAFVVGFASVSSAAAAATISVAHGDRRDYSTIRLTLVSSDPLSRPPGVAEKGSPATAGLEAQNHRHVRFSGAATRTILDLERRR